VSSPSHDDLARSTFNVGDEEIDQTTQVVDVSGEVDLYSAPDLKKHVIGAIEGGKTNIIVDLSKATFIDSTTLGVLVGARKRLRTHGGSLAVICPDPDQLGLFEMTGLDRVFSIHTDRASALSAIQAGGATDQ
jgi:anti-sigma B factor antagonist